MKIQDIELAFAAIESIDNDSEFISHIVEEVVENSVDTSKEACVRIVHELVKEILHDVDIEGTVKILRSEGVNEDEIKCAEESRLTSEQTPVAINKDGERSKNEKTKKPKYPSDSGVCHKVLDLGKENLVVNCNRYTVPNPSINIGEENCKKVLIQPKIVSFMDINPDPKLVGAAQTRLSRGEIIQKTRFNKRADIKINKKSKLRSLVLKASDIREENSTNTKSIKRKFREEFDTESAHYEHQGGLLLEGKGSTKKRKVKFGARVVKSLGCRNTKE